MGELLASVWMYLLGAGIVGLAFGWLLRGIIIPRAKSVHVTAPLVDIPAHVTDEQQEKLDDADRALAEVKQVSAQNKALREQTSQLQSALKAAQAAVVSAEQKAAEDRLSSESAGAADVWSQRYLASRVRHLETRLSGQAPEKDSEPSQIVPETQDDPGLDRWMRLYLETRNKILTSEIAALKGQVPDRPLTEPAELVLAQLDKEERRAELEALKFELAQFSDELRTARAKASEAEKLRAELKRLSELVETKVAAEQSDDENTQEAQNPIAPVDTGRMARLDWQNRYLKARVNFLENSGSLTSQPAETNDELKPSDEMADLQSEIKRLKSALAKTSQGSSEAEQELVRLRWRNRYLEGRLNYLDAASLDAASEADDDILPTVGEDAEPLKGDDVGVDPVGFLSEFESEPMEPEHGPQTESNVSTAEHGEIIEEVRPASLDKPNGDADDLKKIGGIGPKIEGILNALGIFHYSQIADWTRNEAAWIDSYLRFQGRVMREQWVAQASDLARAAAD